MSVYTERKTCRACERSGLRDVLSLGNQYLANFVRMKDPNLPRAPLDLVRCDVCGLLQLKHMVDPDLMWREYWYRSSVNQTMRDALVDVVLDGQKYAKEGVWLDIGANDGYLLSRVPERFTKIACEPALNMQSLLEEHADKIIPDYFTAERFLEQQDDADVITSCAMFYDLNDPDRFVQDIARCLSPEGIWINQLADAPTMMRRNAFDSICHEHACYYDVASLHAMYLRHGLHIINIRHNTINGGSVRVTAAKARGTGSSPLLGVAETQEQDVVAFADRVRRWKSLAMDLLDLPAVRSSELWGLGASTKGCALLQYLGSDQVVAIGDRNPSKAGTLMAGTWTPVFDEATMRKAKPKYVIPLVWGFRDEILQREASMRAEGAVFLFPLPNMEFVL